MFGKSNAILFLSGLSFVVSPLHASSVLHLARPLLIQLRDIPKIGNVY